MQTTATQWPSGDDLAFGPGATRFEKGMSYAGGFALALYLILQLRSGAVDWPVWKAVLAVVIALDLGAGTVANTLESCAKYYHAGPLPGDPWLVRQLKNPLIFALLHIYPLLVGSIYGPASWMYGLTGYGLMVISSLAVIRAPRLYQRPIAYLSLALVIVFAQYLPAAPAGFDWLLAVLFLKIVAGHSVAGPQ
jgi:hypothetical protein